MNTKTVIDHVEGPRNVGEVRGGATMASYNRGDGELTRRAAGAPPLASIESLLSFEAKSTPRSEFGALAAPSYGIARGPAGILRLLQ